MEINIAEIVKQNENAVLNLPPVSVPYILMTKCAQEVTIDADVHLQNSCNQPFQATNVFVYKIQNHKIIAQGKDVKTVYDLTLNTQSSINHQYRPGDTIGILPTNFDEDVDYLVEHLGLEADCGQVYLIEMDPTAKKKNAKLPVYVPKLVQLRKLLAECLDLRAIPKKLFIRALIDYTSDETEKRFISILCNKDGSAFDDMILKRRLGFVALLKTVPSCKPPVSLLIEHLPRLMPRPYSIANYNGSLENNSKIRIIFSIENQAPGLTTSFLRRCCDSGKSINVYFRKSSSFVYSDEDLDRDVLLIGVGTGIAPYLGFLERRRKANEPSQRSTATGRAWLFAGFRYEQTSYICREEIEQYLRNQTLDNLSVAFSRDEASRFRYVQEQIEANKEVFVRMLCNANSKLYVCGDGKMMLPQIENKIVEVLSDVLKICGKDAKLLIVEQKKNHKYIEDVWL